MLRFVLGLLYFFRFHFVFLFVKSYVGSEVCALASHLVFCFQLEGRSQTFENLGGGGLKFLGLRGYQFGEGVLLFGGQYPITCHHFFLQSIIYIAVFLHQTLFSCNTLFTTLLEEITYIYIYI